MAKLIAQEPTPVLDSNSYGFSGRKVTVEFLKTKDNEPRDIFVGCNLYHATIKRGVPVTIPEEVFAILRDAKYSDFDEDPDVPDRKVWVEKQRYPYNLMAGPQ